MDGPATSRWDPSTDGAILIDPPAADWDGLLQRAGEIQRAPGIAAQTRAQLGLPGDRPVIASGHQPQLWHPGILAKWFAMDAAVQRIPGSVRAWVAVDHDTEDPTAVAIPVNQGGIWRRSAWRWAPPLGHEVPVGAADSFEPLALPDLGEAPECVAAGLRRAHAALSAAHALPGVRSLAAQVTEATVALLGSHASRSAIVYRGGLCSSAGFAELIQSMRRDPEACVLAYNRAVRAHPEAGLRLLLADDINDRWELPLWRIEPGRPRVRVFAEDLDSTPPGQLAPRAILLTATLRAFACDLFIHGLGGGIYDRACEAWITGWRPDLPLAPTAVVSATLHLPLAAEPPASTAEVARARWAVHHAMHNPGSVGDPAAQHAKSRAVARLAGLPRRSTARRDAFTELHGVLDRSRAEHGSQLAELRSIAQRAMASLSSAQVVRARDWAFCLYPDAMLAGLRSRIAGRFPTGAATAGPSSPG